MRSESKPAAFRLAPTDEVSDRNNCTCNVRVAKSGQFHHGALKWSASKRPAAIDRVTNDILAGCGRELLARVRQDHASAPASDPHAGVAPGDDDSESCGSRLCVGEPIRACLVDAQHCGQCDRRFLCGLAHPNAGPACVNDACALICSLGFADCNGIFADGCETNLQNDRRELQRMRRALPWNL